MEFILMLVYLASASGGGLSSSTGVVSSTDASSTSDTVESIANSTSRNLRSLVHSVLGVLDDEITTTDQPDEEDKKLAINATTTAITSPSISSSSVEYSKETSPSESNSSSALDNSFTTVVSAFSESIASTTKVAVLSSAIAVDTTVYSPSTNNNPITTGTADVAAINITELTFNATYKNTSDISKTSAITAMAAATTASAATTTSAVTTISAVTTASPMNTTALPVIIDEPAITSTALPITTTAPTIAIMESSNFPNTLKSVDSTDTSASAVVTSEAPIIDVNLVSVTTITAQTSVNLNFSSAMDANKTTVSLNGSDSGEYTVEKWIPRMVTPATRKRHYWPVVTPKNWFRYTKRKTVMTTSSTPRPDNLQSAIRTIQKKMATGSMLAGLIGLVVPKLLAPFANAIMAPKINFG